VLTPSQRLAGARTDPTPPPPAICTVRAAQHRDRGSTGSTIDPDLAGSAAAAPSPQHTICGDTPTAAPVAAGPPSPWARDPARTCTGSCGPPPTPRRGRRGPRHQPPE
jgi:hypothetical protein